MDNTLRFIAPDDKAISYMGRIDFKNPLSPKIIFAGTTITLRFKGTRADIKLLNHKFYNAQELGVVIDGKVTKLTYDDHWEPVTLTAVQGLEDTEHELVIYKRQDASHYFDFLGFYIDGEVLPASKKPSRRIECYGDSVSSGQVCEACDYLAKQDPEGHEGTYDNSWYSYSMITARNLGAQIHNVAQGGIAILDNTGYYHAPTFIGMETAYNKLCYFPEGEGGYSDWDFSQYIPHVVIMAVGQNDPHNEGNPDNDINEPQFRERWTSKYKEILKDLRSHYPKAAIILTTTVLCHSVDWDNAIDSCMQELRAEGMENIYHLMYKRNGLATPGHPRILEQYEMASELTAFISSLGDNIWED